MKTIKKYLLPSVALASIVLPVAMLSCSSVPEKSEAPIAAATLWQQQCIRCHEYRTPSAYSDAQWDAVMLHMRTRANLPADDARAILAFLKSAN